MVGTTNRSIAAMPSAWLRRNVRQPWDGGPLLRAMYFVWTSPFRKSYPEVLMM
jgi:hypothetical protein